MKTKLYKFFSWMKDHFSLLFVVLLRLRIGEKKNKENPEDIEVEDSKKGSNL